jgi:hypothetical protein
MKKEINSIYKNNTWKIVDRPAGKTPIMAKWIYKLKKDSSGNLSKLKARIVARGFQQTEEVDFSEIISSCRKILLASQINRRHYGILKWDTY